MGQRDNKFLKGFVTISKFDARTGALKQQEVRNLVTTVGEQWVADRMLANDAGLQNQGSAQMRWIELGLSALAPAAADTDLKDTFGPSSEVRQQFDTNQRIGATWRLICNWSTSQANTNSIEEAGIFSSAAQGSGIMLARTTFTAVNKTNSDTLKIQWDINVADDGV